jgi:MoxR-like ATPase
VKELSARVKAALEGVVVGQQGVIDGILTGLAARGHVLLEGPPGVAKTLIANALARVLGIDFARVQFTPDMLPSDLTGTMTLRGGNLTFRPGPVFTNVLLADEINRTPPKTQAALLESMQEAQVSIEGEPHELPDPFMVIATQNPIEHEGTYPLPEAQLDRFLLRIDVGYPSAEEEGRVLALAHQGAAAPDLERLDPVVGVNEIAQARAEVDATRVAPELAAYVVALVRRTRELPSVALGASPRAAVHLLAAARATARLAGRDYVIPDDVIAVAPQVLAHRLLLSPDAELEGFRPTQAVESALGAVPVPR